MAFLYEPHVEEELRLNLNNTFMENYRIDDRKTRAIDLMQTEVCINRVTEKQFPIWKITNMGSRELPLTNGEKAFKKDTVKWKITKTKC